MVLELQLEVEGLMLPELQQVVRHLIEVPTMIRNIFFGTSQEQKLSKKHSNNGKEMELEKGCHYSCMQIKQVKP